MLRATIGVGLIAAMVYHSPERRPWAAPDLPAAGATALGLRGALPDGSLETALAGAALGRVFLENARPPGRVISLVRPPEPPKP